jgi:pimeloyl-ACP methyl ester carboxylesterase
MRSALLVLAAVTAATVLVGLGYRRDMGEARARVASGSRMASTPCGPIEYADVGSGAPVLLVHGAGGGFDQGLDLAQPLIADGGFRVIAVSRFGYLRTRLLAGGSAAAQADAHRCVLDALHLERAGVVGFSAGAPSAMQLCLRHPERCSALVLVAPATFAPRLPGDTRPERPAFLVRLMDATLRSDFLFWAFTKMPRNLLLQALLGTPPKAFDDASPDERAGALRTVRHLLPMRMRAMGMQNDAAVVSSLPRYDLERISAPTLLVSAEDDLFGTFPGARYTAEHIPGARFVGFPAGGHLLMGHAGEVAAEITAFLRNPVARSAR